MFTLLFSDKSSQEHNCNRKFVWNTLLACKNATIPKDYSHQKDTCHIYHPVLRSFVDFSRLSPSSNGQKPFVVEGDDLMNNEGNLDTDENGTKKKIEYLINVCKPKHKDIVPGCKGSICMKDDTRNKTFSLGRIKNVIYSFDHKELIVHYTNGDRCDDFSKDSDRKELHGGLHRRNYSSEIHFECDLRHGKDWIGKPELFVELPCHPVFNWKTGVVCDTIKSSSSSSSKSKDTNGTFWMVSFIVALSLLVIAFLWSPQRRERLRQTTENALQYVRRSSLRMDETNLLVTSNVTIPTFSDTPSSTGMEFGRLSDDDDDELIIA